MTFNHNHPHQLFDQQVRAGESLLLMGPSGAGKTSLLRAVAGLWDRGNGTIARATANASPAAPATAATTSGNGNAAVEGTHDGSSVDDNGAEAGTVAAGADPEAGGAVAAGGPRPQDIMFVPQRPYVVLGSLRDQLLYPTWSDLGDDEQFAGGG